ncbi:MULTISPECIES: glycosyltransferase family 4 protein [Clostridium]|uniref:glycosyltransferase family 4 protein n=1 Tax=Clostridium TaxID=1485 RepID=UPI0028FEB013|nr:glycosyltransferase family 4 protein [Clostridium sp.]MDU1968947.1 glycosyltransferase family 4 protein [Clostridium perfringens]MDU1824559.1 glycosyltransferase family 4 protein [Clostridium sp.]MDU1842076.1 glycosyltransferase family 4 protein [Clostridium sp.]MDU2691642.1 glycosyltransferase family 4 protein [Clostridium sp.]MDU2957492.1 glycosyltransferase family 4 protein [Clostridium sp.]
MNHDYKILVAHSAQQHSFRTAIAIKEAGCLFKYITTVYDKKGSLTGLTKKFLKGETLVRANTRKSTGLLDDEVVQFYELFGLILLFLQRVDKKKYIYNLWDKIIVYLFNRKVAKYAIKNRVDAVIMYDTLGECTFKILKNKAPNINRILDMSAPNIEYMDYILKKEINSNNSKILSEELNSKLYKSKLESGIREIKLAQNFLVASNFTKNSLIYSNVNEKKIHICRYGIDCETFKINRKNTNCSTEVINVIFIGNITQKKGISYISEVINKININKYRFTFIGNYNSECEYYKMLSKKCNFTGHITKEKVIEYCNNSDILIFPSLADGFGLSVLEALACGVPVICSKNAGISDLIIDKYNGFKVDAMDSEAIYKRLIWLGENRQVIEEMRCNCRSTALACKWENYNCEIKTAISDILN